MKYDLHKNEDRGRGDYGWLKTNYSFSFSNYYNPNKMGYGRLIVLNDDTVAPSSGFDMHSHKDMEIVTLVLKGELTHKDNMGNVGTVKEGEIQVMSAGSGVTHSEYNNSKDVSVELLQLWIHTDEKGVEPRYEQSKQEFLKGNWNRVVSSYLEKDKNNTAWFYADAKIDIGIFDKDTDYKISKDKCVFFFVIEGEVQIADQVLKSRDAIGISETDNITILVNKTSKILAIETNI